MIFVNSLTSSPATPPRLILLQSLWLFAVFQALKHAASTWDAFSETIYAAASPTFFQFQFKWYFLKKAICKPLLPPHLLYCISLLYFSFSNIYYYLTYYILSLIISCIALSPTRTQAP